MEHHMKVEGKEVLALALRTCHLFVAAFESGAIASSPQADEAYDATKHALHAKHALSEEGELRLWLRAELARLDQLHAEN